jgi:hypothetical protein
MGRRSSVVLAAAALAFAATSARAEPTPAERSAADALFFEARKLMDVGDLEPACAKLEESQRIAPRGGTLLTLGICHEKQGRLASAWGELTDALALAQREARQDRVDLAKQRLAVVTPLVPKLTVRVASQPVEVTVRRDGAVVGSATFGTPLPVDPGRHTVVATAPGRTPFEATFDLAAGAARSVDIPALRPSGTVVESMPFPGANPSRVVPVAGSSPSQVEPADSGRRGSWRRPVGFIVGGLGAASMITGAVLGAEAIAKHHASDPNCPNDVCDQAGWDAYSTGKSEALASDLTVGIGAAAVAVGVLLVVTGGARSAPKIGSARPVVGVAPGHAFAGVGGAW